MFATEGMFYSSLKQCNVLESKVRNQYERLTRTDQKSRKEALTILRLESELLQIWDEKNYENIQGLLTILFRARRWTDDIRD